MPNSTGRIAADAFQAWRRSDTPPHWVSIDEEQIMSFVKIARPVGLAALLALGVAASGAAEARTGLHSQHGPSASQSANPNGPAYPGQSSGR